MEALASLPHGREQESGHSLARQWAKPQGQDLLRRVDMGRVEAGSDKAQGPSPALSSSPLQDNKA